MIGGVDVASIGGVVVDKVRVDGGGVVGVC